MSLLPINAFSLPAIEIQILTSWEDDQNEIKVAIVNRAGLDDDKITTIKKIILSEEYYAKNGKMYFEGWSGALQTLDGVNTKAFKIVVSEKSIEGDIIIELLKEKNPKYNGFTTPTYDSNHMTSAQIQIFDAPNIPPMSFENIIRHEFGHALGLGHTNDHNSIMYETIGTEQKFITLVDMCGLRAVDEGITFKSVPCTFI